MVRPTPACFHLLGKESITPPRKKLDSPILIEENASRRRPGKFTDRGLKKDHRVTPIEHFLIDINQILLRDCIENTIADIGRCEAATDIVQPTLRNLFYKRWPIIFLYGKGSFVLGVAYNIFNVGRQGFFALTQPKLCFGRHRNIFIFFFGKENISQPRQKKHDSPILIEKHASRRRPGKMTDRFLKKKHHRMTPIEHFLIDLIQLLVRD